MMSLHYVNELLFWLFLGVTLIDIAVKGESEYVFNMKKQVVSNNTGAAETMQNIESSVDCNNTVFFSLEDSIYRRNTSQENGTSLRTIENGLEIIAFHQISTQRFLVGDAKSVKIYQLSNNMNNSTVIETLVCTTSGCCQESHSRCRENKDYVPKPTTVDHRSQIAYYIDNVTIYRVNLLTNHSATKFTFNSMGKEVTAMAFNDNYTTAYLACTDLMNVFSFNFQTRRSNHILIRGNPSIAIAQLISIDDGLLLCRTQQSTLLLLNIKSGFHSYVHEGMPHLPGITNKSDGDKIEVSDMAHTNDGNILALGKDQELIRFHYDVGSILKDASNIASVTVSNDLSSKSDIEKTEDTAIDVVPTVAGYAAAAVVLVIGVTIAIFIILYKKQKRQLIQKFTQCSRQRRPSVSDRVIEDIELTTFRQRDIEQREDQLDEECEGKIKETTSSEVILASSKPLPPLPDQKGEPLAQNDQTKTSAEPDYVEFLEHVDRPINTQELVLKPPYVRPRLSLPHRIHNSNTEQTIFRQRDVEQMEDQLNIKCENKIKETASSKDTLDRDRPLSPLPRQLPLAHMDSNKTSAETNYADNLDHVIRPIKTQASVPKTPYVRPRLSLLNRECSLELLNRDRHSSKLYLSQSPVVHNDNPHREESPYSDNPCVPTEHCPEYDLYSYACERLEGPSTEEKQEDNKQDISTLQPEIVFTITKMELKVLPRQNNETLKYMS